MLHLDYSIFLAVAALLTFNRLIHEPTGRARLVAWSIFLVAIVACLFVNIGKSGQLAFVITLVVAVSLSLRGRLERRAAIGAALAALVTATALATVPVFRARASGALHEVRAAVEQADYSTNQGKRIAAAIVAADIYLDHPVLGTGVGDTMAEFRDRVDSRYPHLRDAVRDLEHLHNQYLQTATELGFIGLVLLLNVFVQLLRQPTETRQSRHALIILASVYLVAFLGDPFLHKQLPLVLFCVTVGALLSERLNLWSDLRAPDPR
jgi:O-antigen ligase